MAKKGVKKDTYVSVCPTCKSTNVHPNYADTFGSTIGPSSYICDDCQNKSYVFPEVKKSELEDFQKGTLDVEAPDQSIVEDVVSDSDISTNYSHFGVKVIGKITGPIAIIAGLFMWNNNPMWSIVFVVIGVLTAYAAFTSTPK
jgi:hypothetical protein